MGHCVLHPRATAHSTPAEHRLRAPNSQTLTEAVYDDFLDEYKQHPTLGIYHIYALDKPSLRQLFFLDKVQAPEVV